MSGDRDQQSDPAGDASERDDTGERGDASESLKHALDSLETMLDRHGGAGEDGTHAEAETDGNDEQASDDDQYSIPLLNDVVLPPSISTPRSTPRPPLDSDYEEAVERMAERLSSEIDVIVQSAVEEATELLRRDIGERLREHIEITLPEILEELVQQRQGR